MKTVAERFAHARERSGKTQDYLANVCGLTKGAISAIENNRNSISGENLFPLADALGVNARWLMTGVGSINSENEGPIIQNKLERIAGHLAALPDEKVQALSIVLGIKL